MRGAATRTSVLRPPLCGLAHLLQTKARISEADTGLLPLQGQGRGHFPVRSERCRGSCSSSTTLASPTKPFQPEGNQQLPKVHITAS